jgi:hypothetical protein
MSTSTLYEPAPGAPFADEHRGARRRHARTGTAVSVALHGALFAALYLAWSHAPEPPPRARTIELTLTRPEVPQPLVTPQPARPMAQPQQLKPTPPLQRGEAGCAPAATCESGDARCAGRHTGHACGAHTVRSTGYLQCAERRTTRCSTFGARCRH